MSKTSSAVKRRYNQKAYDLYQMSMPKETMNGVLNKFIKAYIEEHEGD